MDEQVKQAREYFRENRSYIHLEQIGDDVIAELLGRSYVQEASFERRMDFLYDYALSQGLCDVTE